MKNQIRLNFKRITKNYYSFNLLIKLNHKNTINFNLNRLFCSKNNQDLTNLDNNTNIIENPKDIQLTNYINSKLANKLTNEEYLKEIEEEMKPTLNPSDPDYFDKLKLMTRQEQRIEFFKHLVTRRKLEDKKLSYDRRIYFALFILFIGIFALWIPFYRVICEHAGLQIKTSVADYNDSNTKINTAIKFRVNFLNEVDEDLPWEFYAQQDSVYINAGETCLVFYKARNKTDKPIVGLSVYDVQPQSCAVYFNKVQCFCFQNQLLGPYQEVDFPVLFYLDPAIQEDKFVQIPEYFDLNLKYTFYYAKYQELASIMQKHLEKERKNEDELNKIKAKLNQEAGYNKYDLTEINTNTLPGVNPLLKEYYIDEESNTTRVKFNV